MPVAVVPSSDVVSCDDVHTESNDVDLDCEHPVAELCPSGDVAEESSLDTDPEPVIEEKVKSRFPSQRVKRVPQRYGDFVLY